MVQSKTLQIYANDCYYKHFDLYIHSLYEVNSRGELVVYHRDPNTGQESVVAHFRVWDHLIIE